MNLFDKSTGAPRFIHSLQSGENVSWFYRVQEITKKKTKNGDDYLDLTLMDKTGRIPAKIWSNVAEYQKLLRAGDVYKINGEIRDYRGKKQLTVSHLRAVASGDPGFAPTISMKRRPLTAKRCWPRPFPCLTKISAIPTCEA